MSLNIDQNTTTITKISENDSDIVGLMPKWHDDDREHIRNDVTDAS